MGPRRVHAKRPRFPVAALRTDKYWPPVSRIDNAYGGNRGFRSDGKPLRFDEIDVFAAEMDDFAQCIMNGKPTKVPGEEGLRDVKILGGALRVGKDEQNREIVVAVRIVGCRRAAALSVFRGSRSSLPQIITYPSSSTCPARRPDAP